MNAKLFTRNLRNKCSWHTAIRTVYRNVVRKQGYFPTFLRRRWLFNARHTL